MQEDISQQKYTSTCQQLLPKGMLPYNSVIQLPILEDARKYYAFKYQENLPKV